MVSTYFLNIYQVFKVTPPWGDFEHLLVFTFYSNPTPNWGYFDHFWTF